MKNVEKKIKKWIPLQHRKWFNSTFTCLALLLYAKLCSFIVANARLSGLRPTCHEPIAALSISHSSTTPAFFTSSINTASAIGERQILPNKWSKINLFRITFCLFALWTHLPKQMKSAFFLLSDVIALKCFRNIVRMLAICYCRREWK